MKKSYTEKHIDFLRAGYRKKGIPDLTRSFNKKFLLDKAEGAIKGIISRYKITCGRTTGELNRGRSRILSQAQNQYIKKYYPLFSQKELTARFNKRFGTSITEQQIRCFTRNHKIQSGRTGRFEKGHKTWNAGTKGVCHGSSTSFKKGHMPANTRPLGTERIDNKDGYIHVKITEPNPYTKAMTRFKQKHVVVWEREHGPVPKGMAVVFVDGNKLNCDTSNLMLVSRAELLRLNQYNYKDLPEEIKPSLLALAKLEVKTFSLMRA